MNEQAQQLITDAGAKVLEYLEATEGFAIEQAPLLAQEILSWGLTLGVAGVSISLIITALIWILGLKIKAACKEDNPHWGKDDEAFSFAMMLLVSGLPCILLAAGMSTVLKVLVAPRLYIIEKISTLF